MVARILTQIFQRPLANLLQEDVENLNEVAHNRPRAQLVLGIQQENRYHIKLLVFSCPGSSIPDLGQWVTGDCHFRILTQRVTFETSDPSDIWSE